MLCKNCRWWRISYPKSKTGECRRYPRSVLLQGLHTAPDLWRYTLQYAHDWCGEFKEQLDSLE